MVAAGNGHRCLSMLALAAFVIFSIGVLLSMAHGRPASLISRKKATPNPFKCVLRPSTLKPPRRDTVPSPQKRVNQSAASTKKGNGNVLRFAGTAFLFYIPGVLLA